MSRETKRIGRVGVFPLDDSLINREMAQDYIPEEDYDDDDRELFTAVEQTREQFSLRDVEPGNRETEPWLSQAERDGELLEANAEGVADDIGRFTADEEILEDFEERQQIQNASQQMYHHLRQHNAKSPELTAGDVDAAWEEADVGDETPGGLHPAPTPEQDIVDNIGRASGLTYEDDEELHSVEKIRDRDEHRWELDPASADDDETLDDEEEGRDRRPDRI